MTPKTKQIDAILPFLDQFTADGFSVGTLHSPPNQVSWFEFSKPVMQCEQALYDNGWIRPSFDWTEWHKTAREYVLSPEKIDSADTKTIQKLFTTHFRKERFCQGHLAAMFENGHIVALLRRLQTLRDRMSP